MSYGFKALRKGRRGTHATHFTYPEAGEWVEVGGELEPCYNGLHFAPTLSHILDVWLDQELWLIEVDDSERIDLPDKSVTRRARLVRKLPLDDRTMLLFAVDCGQHLIDEALIRKDLTPEQWASLCLALELLRERAAVSDTVKACDLSGRAYAQAEEIGGPVPSTIRMLSTELSFPSSRVRWIVEDGGRIYGYPFQEWALRRFSLYVAGVL